MQKQTSSQSSLAEITINQAIIAIKTDLPLDLCSALMDQYSPLANEDATVKFWKDNDSKYDQGESIARKTKIHWIPQQQWVGGMIQYYIDNINSQYFKYDLTEISGGHLQYSVYAKGGHYDWHTDEPRSLYYVTQQNSLIRKLSFSLQLSDSEDYEGGDLVFQSGTYEEPEEVVQPRGRGTLVVFDSRQMHKVTPVTSGVRHSLVGWIKGPVWK